jgi:DNA-binding transcriptional LysR family regulator
VRSARHTTLTGAGAELLTDARETLAAAERLVHRAGLVGRGGLGRVGVAFVWSTLGGYLATLVAAATERHRSIELAVSQLRFGELSAAVRRGDVDLAISRVLLEETELIERTLNREPSVLALPEDHPLADRPTVGTEQLHGEALIGFRREIAPRHHDLARSALRRAGIIPREYRAVTSASEALALVRAGLGLFRLPATAAVPTPGVIYRELEGVLTRTVLLRRPEPPSPAVAAIAALIEELFYDAQSASKNARFALEGAAGEA